jgi:bifunctional ADP-heptose synthase (sugar kinase/adenylyltransferase)
MRLIERSIELIIKKNGGIVETIDLVQGYSSTEILKKGAQ